MVAPNEGVGIALLSQESSEVFELESDLPSPTSFTLATIGNGYFDSNNRFQGTTMSLPETFVLSARGSEGTFADVKFVDQNGYEARFRLALRPIDQYYELDLHGPQASIYFDRGHVAQILLIQDRQLTLGREHSLLKIKMQGLKYSPPVRDPALEETRDLLITKGALYFKAGAGLDPVTHFPYDSLLASGTADASAKFTQPTLIGFYLQILADVAGGKLDNGLSQDDALDEIQWILAGLIDAQKKFGWKGLLPWLNLDPYEPRKDDAGNIWYALGDNANLAQSLAVMIGSLELANFDAARRAKADALTVLADTFLDAQQLGYEKMVDPFLGEFAASVNDKGVYNFFMDRLVNEFRGAIAFLRVRYPSLPASVWDKLNPTLGDYTDRNGKVIGNLTSFDGGLFQLTWPSLRNDESDFLGFRSALYNQLLSQADHAYQRGLPGFVSASQRPNADPAGHYEGRMGMTELAELPANDMLTDVGSTYALASAYSIDPDFVLSWLTAIREQLPALSGTYGFLDAARSNGEIASRFLGIDVASSVLGLLGTGPDSFAAYLKKRGKELEYNLLYDAKSQFPVERTDAIPAMPGKLPDRSMAVFSHYKGHGVVNNYPYDTTGVNGARFLNFVLPGGYGGLYWDVPAYNARNNELELVYSTVNTPGKVKLEFKDAAGQLLYTTDVMLPQGVSRQRTILTLPDAALLSNVACILMIVDQNATGDTSADFFVHSLNFRHYPNP